MTILNQEFVFRLRIKNATRRNFHCIQADLNQGRWFRDGTDDLPPAAIPAGQEIEALGIRMRTGKTTGYDCRCVWADAEDEEGKTGSVALTVVVPFLMGKNRAGLDVSGPYKVEGWTGLPRIGREFSQSLVIQEVPW